MKKLAALYFFFGLALNLNAQLIKKSDLEGFRWFTDNSIKSFYKSDTVSLIRITDTLTDFLLWNKQYRELDYNNNNNITQIEFKKKKELDISDTDVESWTEKRLVGKWKWEFNVKTQTISFYFKQKLFSSFIIKEKSTDMLVWKYDDFRKKPQEAIFHLLIFKMVRIK